MTTASADKILVLNAGSSSLKFAVFDGMLAPYISGMASGIGGVGSVEVNNTKTPQNLPDHEAALREVLKALSRNGVDMGALRAAGHRVVHGGREMSAPVRVTDDICARIDACAPLAPLHNPHNLAAIRTLQRIAPDLPQVASFDTAFHATNPEVAQRYAVSRSVEAYGIRRYGFHGLSYAAMVETFQNVTGRAVPERLLGFHLGNGSSICAMQNGKSVATTMGYSPLEGLTMGTRSGSMDPNAVLHLVQEEGANRTRAILNLESGLLGLSGKSADMRSLMQDPTSDDSFAIEHFCYWAMRHAGSLIAAMGGVDAIAFSGGIGENSASVRARILEQLSWLNITTDLNANSSNSTKLHIDGSQVGVWIIPAREEWMIAQHTRSLI